MARVKDKTPSTRGYFKQLFIQHPEWLEDSSTAAVLDRWQQDHPNQELTASIRSGLSNIKSQMRMQRGLRKGRKKARAARAAKPASSVEATQRVRRVSTPALEKLETLIDSCLAQARGQADDDLVVVIHHLRNARNTVIHKLGQD